MGVTVVTTVEYTDTWTVIAMDMDIHAVETTMVVIVEVTCTLIAEIITQDHATSMLTAHAEDTDTDTHAEDLITTVTAMLTSETMDTHQVHHVVMDSTCTWAVTVVTAATTAQYTDTWTVIATDMDTHAVETTMVVIVEVTCTLIAEITTQDHATSMLTAHAEDTDTAMIVEPSATQTTATDQSYHTEMTMKMTAEADSTSVCTDTVMMIAIAMATTMVSTTIAITMENHAEIMDMVSNTICMLTSIAITIHQARCAQELNTMVTSNALMDFCGTVKNV